MKGNLPQNKLNNEELLLSSESSSDENGEKKPNRIKQNDFLFLQSPIVVQGMHFSSSGELIEQNGTPDNSERFLEFLGDLKKFGILDK